MALALARAGAVVVIAGRRPESLAEVAKEAGALGLAGRVIAQPADISDAAAVASVVSRVEHEAGRLDGWVNNACSSSMDGLLEASWRAVQQTMNVGFTAAFQALQIAARAMLPRRKGTIINIASMYGMVSPQPAAYQSAPQFHNPPAYGAAKAALLQLTRYAACHLARHGIRVNAISPGPFPSPVVQENRDFCRALEARVPLGRIGQPDELVGALIFLLSDASSYVTGHNLVVDGGWTAW
jgi:gluconate 5-dehydrogenase